MKCPGFSTAAQAGSYFQSVSLDLSAFPPFELNTRRLRLEIKGASACPSSGNSIGARVHVCGKRKGNTGVE